MLAYVFNHLAITRVGKQFVQRRLEVGLCIFPPIIAEFDEWQHVLALSECDDAVYLVQSESVGEVEL